MAPNLQQSLTVGYLWITSSKLAYRPWRYKWKGADVERRFGGSKSSQPEMRQGRMTYPALIIHIMIWLVPNRALADQR